ncbi:helix-turn-helix domain-containing protein [Streptomyces sp. NPDC053079]|uniref:helix-turn-helix domain-containing protein n=1 Tax=Streptomyces sp. NPDC053079 TaxID=3365697 RepID=UPI0037CCCC78
MTDPAAVPLWHGYTFRDIEQIARLVIAIDRWSHAMGTPDRYQAAQFAITERLLTAEAPPTRNDLINTGLRAADLYVQAEFQTHGFQGPIGFARYWQTTGHVPWEEKLVECVALAQIWPRLTLAQQQAIMSLALTEDHQAAAVQLGLSPSGFAYHLANARKQAIALWHEHETPRPLPKDQRIGNRSGEHRGRRMLTEQDLEAIRDRRAEGATIRDLAKEVGYSTSGLGNLLTGKRRPAHKAA